MSVGDWIATSLTVFGFGFSLWAFMLKKAIESLNDISKNLVSIDKRLSALEQWKQYRDEELALMRKDHS